MVYLRHVKYIQSLVFMFFLRVFFFYIVLTFCTLTPAQASEQERAETEFASAESISLYDLYFRNRLEFNSGVEVRPDSFFGYGGITASVLGEQGEQGWRLKWNSGAGEYKYQAHPVSGGLPVIYTGNVSVYDLMLGYYFRENDLIAKIYVGANYTEHRVSPLDTGNDVRGEAVGVKAQAELWYGIGGGGWASLDLSYANSFGDYLALGRSGYDFTSSFSLGVEGAVSGNANYSSSRLGGVMRLKLDVGEITLNAGMGGDDYALDNWDPYGGVSFFQKF